MSKLVAKAIDFDLIVKEKRNGNLKDSSYNIVCY